jgi:hypothetical protein
MSTQTPEGRDRQLWLAAKKRVSFRSHLMVYLLVNAFLWGVWFFSGNTSGHDGRYPWPIWTTLGWGLGLTFHYLGAFVFHTTDAVEKEYQKLKQKNNQL